MLSNSPSSVDNASTKRCNVAALTKRTRTVSHSKCEISSSESCESTETYCVVSPHNLWIWIFFVKKNESHPNIAPRINKQIESEMFTIENLTMTITITTTTQRQRVRNEDRKDTHTTSTRRWSMVSHFFQVYGKYNVFFTLLTP